MKLKIKKPRDWGSITWKQCADCGGATLLGLYGGSLFKVLQKFYPDIQWKIEWFPNIKRYPRRFWKNEDNCLIFLEDFAKRHQLKTPKDWQKVSLALVRKSGGQVELCCDGVHF